jgi:glutamate-1-semialdehyde 2,1-aminomutase
MIKSKRFKYTASKEFGRALEELVPGGAHTYSKGRDQFPAESPNGIQRGKGAWIWDIDGNKILDWSMGLTSVSIGHADDRVNSAVIEAIGKGVNFQRPAALELEAAEAFLDFSSTDMVKFAKHGSSVTSAAVKLSRGYTRRSKVAVPNQHPFFSFDDWFIGSTEADFGVPEELKSLTLKFDYNNIESLEKLFHDNPYEIACVMMEPVKFDPPESGYLNCVKDLCSKNGAVFVLDEMITGLKIANPGAAKYFGVEADLYTYGKGIANGFACAALTGRGDIMRLGGLEPENKPKMFLLSTTHGAESSGLAAMMKTLSLYKKENFLEHNWSTGQELRIRLNKVVAQYDLSDHMRISGYDSMMLLEIINLPVELLNKYKTFFMQEMLANGVLLQGLLILTPSHGTEEIKATEIAFDRACCAFLECLKKKSIKDKLVGPEIKPVFRKLN